MKKLLIANRGEIAVRIIRTAREMGIATVAVVSEADEFAYVTEVADEVVVIGPPPAGLSYLNHDSVLRAAADTGADAVHPGYGFLSENAEFARKVIAAGMIWVGPSPESIELMGDKSRARRAAHGRALRHISPHADQRRRWRDCRPRCNKVRLKDQAARKIPVVSRHPANPD